MIRLADLLNEAKMPKVLFHSVKDEKTKDFVIQNGIKSDENSMVYLSAKPIGSPFKYTFKVEVPDMYKLHDWREVWSDSDDKEYDAKNPYYVYEGDIPKQYVTLIDTSESNTTLKENKPPITKMKVVGLVNAKKKQDELEKKGYVVGKDFLVVQDRANKKMYNITPVTE